MAFGSLLLFSEDEAGVAAVLDFSAAGLGAASPEADVDAFLRDSDG